MVGTDRAFVGWGCRQKAEAESLDRASAVIAALVCLTS